MKTIELIIYMKFILCLNSSKYQRVRTLQYYNIRVIYAPLLIIFKGAEKNEMSTIDKEKLAKEFINSLDQSVKVLIILREELYDGSWELMLKDLQSRLKGEPFIYKLANQIDADIQGIAKIQSFEEKNSINLGKYINLSTEGSAQ